MPAPGFELVARYQGNTAPVNCLSGLAVRKNGFTGVCIWMTGIRAQRLRRLCLRLTNFCKLDRPKDERLRFRFCCLPRKEVIQPHLPIRLPCYDFTPVIDLTFGG